MFFFLIFFVSYLAYLAACRQQTASSKDVLSAAGTYCREDAVCSQIITERFHSFLVAPVKWHVRYLMKAYQVDSAFQSVQQFYYCARMCVGVVEAAKHNIFK